MPLFAITARDKPDHLELRMSTRDSHLVHLRALGERLHAAGPLLDGDGKPCGSLVIVEMDDNAEAQAFAEADPYEKAGLFAAVDVSPWNALIGAWVEGASESADEGADEEE